MEVLFADFFLANRRSQPSWDAPMAVSEPLSLPAAPFGLSTCGVSSRSTPALAALAVRERGKEFPHKGVGKLGDKENSIGRSTTSSSAIAYDIITTSSAESAVTSRSTDSLRHSGSGKSATSASRLLKESDVNAEKNTALWLSRHKKKPQEPVSRKSYEDIYEEVASGHEGQTEGQNLPDKH
ncbi:hypothetical protein BIW11_14032, partial [Tropilaelaps mercedesae]